MIWLLAVLGGGLFVACLVALLAVYLGERTDPDRDY
jgi:hypothetical protein